MTRQEEERDPEAEAEFDRAFEKMVAESLESRRFERKTMFDVPLPMRPRQPATTTTTTTDDGGEGQNQKSNTMAFSLMTRKGNRQQTRTIELPSDSSLAVAMRTQQQADREEQQRIKNLVLNYDHLVDDDNNDGMFSHPLLSGMLIC